MAAEIYELDPDAAPDGEFIAGVLAHAVVGNRGRLLDARRTPLSITAVAAEHGEFEVRVDAFEDRGARWRLPLWEVARLQFTADSTSASSEVLTSLEQAVDRFDRPLVIDAKTQALAGASERINEQRRLVGELLRNLTGSVDLAASIRQRRGDSRLFAILDRFLAERGLVELDRTFCQTMISNPHSSELVKGHAIVLAELGLCPYRGTIIRDPVLFDGDRSRARRAEHLIARLAFAQELWNSCVREPLTLYRAAAVDGPLPPPRPASMVACTFSENVAAVHFAGGPTTQTAVMWRQVVPTERLLMTFLETPAMNDRFREAEAVVIGDPTNLAF